ncbi:MAG: tRNA (N6-threonylcarbamoyladenosine(37)-N6)-methyltransferase TrmO, partial [Bacteroidales bacterium]|nr:tRNA (N6-threonylcarbamoyladenosine(37)-N6)-methyltransferase TrmO [Bacteroidales bacterium]
MKPIAHIETDFGSKFGVPRQSGLVPELEGRIVFEPAYRVPEAFRGLEGFSHIWLLWDFSESHQEEWSPTVRPPRLGGNVRVGVFATRSPFRPNPIGLSCVQLSRIELDSPDGPVLWVRGADLMDGTPIFDIKPYLPFADSHPEASGGFTDQTKEQPELEVEFSPEVENLFTSSKLMALRKVLASDPRPHYQHDDNRVYGLEFNRQNIHFSIKNGKISV